jgi:hypothetical protein
MEPELWREATPDEQTYTIASGPWGAHRIVRVPDGAVERMLPILADVEWEFLQEYPQQVAERLLAAALGGEGL